MVIPSSPFWSFLLKTEPTGQQLNWVLVLLMLWSRLVLYRLQTGPRRDPLPPCVSCWIWDTWLGFSMSLVHSSWWAALHTCATVGFLSILLPASEGRDSCCLLLTSPGPASVLGRSYVLWFWSRISQRFPAYMKAKFFLLSMCVFVHVCATRIPGGWMVLGGRGFPSCCPSVSRLQLSLSLCAPKHDQGPTRLLGQIAVLSALRPWGIFSLPDPGDGWFITCVPVA